MTDEPTESINLTIRIESITNGYLVSCDGSKATRNDPLAQFSIGRDPAYRATLDEVKRDVDWLIGINHGRAKEIRERREKQEREWDERHGFPTDPYFERESPLSGYKARTGPPITPDPTFAMRSGPAPTVIPTIIEDVEPAPTDPTPDSREPADLLFPGEEDTPEWVEPVGKKGDDGNEAR